MNNTLAIRTEGSPEARRATRIERILFWVIVAFTIFGATITVVFGIFAFVKPGLVSPNPTMNPAAVFFAHHFAGRNFVIALMMVWPLVLREKKLWVFALFLRGLVEGYDGLFEILETQAMMPGVMFVVYAVLFVASAWYILKLRSNPLEGATRQCGKANGIVSKQGNVGSQGDE
jgi:hypothetical protein